jgi:hypothetical protein
MELVNDDHLKRLQDNPGGLILYVFYSDAQNEVYVADQKRDTLFPCHEVRWRDGGLEVTTSSEWLSQYPRITVWFENGEIRKSVIAFATLLGLVASAAE